MDDALSICVEEIECRMKRSWVQHCPDDTLALMSLALVLVDIRDSLRVLVNSSQE